MTFESHFCPFIHSRHIVPLKFKPVGQTHLDPVQICPPLQGEYMHKLLDQTKPCEHEHS